MVDISSVLPPQMYYLVGVTQQKSTTAKLHLFYLTIQLKYDRIAS